MIVKPESSCQGKGFIIFKNIFLGIFLINKLESLSQDDHYVVQEYVKNPYLIDGLKFDLRIYVMVKSVSPLKIFMFREGLARFSTTPYANPAKKNLGKWL